MISHDPRCPHCSAPVLAGMRFCGACGASIDPGAHDAHASGAAPPARAARPKTTMMGLPVVSVPPPAPISDEASGGRVIPFDPSERRASAGTLRGLPTSGGGRTDEPVAATPSGRSSRGTLMGMPQGWRVEDPAPAQQASRSNHGTLMGMPAVHGNAQATTPPGTITPWGGSAEAAIASNATWSGQRAEPAHYMPLPADPGFAAAPASSWPPAQAQAPSTPPASTEAALAASPAVDRPTFTEARPRHSITYDDRVAWTQSAAKPKRSLLVPLVVAGLAVLALVGGGVGAYLAQRVEGSRVRARIATVDGREALVVEVPGAEPGAKVRFRGQEVPLAAARAIVPFGGDPLSVGDNRVSVGLVGPDGATEQVPLDVVVAFRIRPDLTALTAEPPRFRVRVEAVPGTVVELAGERLALDARGRGSRDFELAGATVENAITESVPYRVTPPGGRAESGVVTARIPVATLELDRPGSALVTDRDGVAVEGAAHSTATVTVNGVPVAVRDGHFKHVAPLPTMGEHRLVVVAREAGHAPEREEVVVRRVADLFAESQTYAVDPALTYASIAADPAAARGRRVALEGVVYNVEVRRGQSMLQVLVSRCGQARCPLWVTYPAATDVGLNQAVRVLGEVDGEQRFRTTGEAEQILSVPRVRAVYVLPISP